MVSARKNQAGISILRDELMVYANTKQEKKGHRVEVKKQVCKLLLYFFFFLVVSVLMCRLVT